MTASDWTYVMRIMDDHYKSLQSRTGRDWRDHDGRIQAERDRVAAGLQKAADAAASKGEESE